jgi:dihydroxy-acid dehydratase
MARSSIRTSGPRDAHVAAVEGKSGGRPLKLRSVFEPGTTRWAVRRAQWLAMGMTEADFDKPKIAIVNSSSKLSVCFAHLDRVAEAVCKAVRGAGGVPLEIRTAAPSDFVTSAGLQGRYLMPTRDLLVNEIEVQVEGAVLDGMVLLSSCDKTTPAHLMAAGRLNVPAIVVPCGYQLGSRCGSDTVDIEDVYKAVGKLKAGQIDLASLHAMTCVAIRGPGVCAGLGTANSMHILAEALGMALPGSAPVRAGSGRNFAMAEAAGHQILSLIRDDLRPRQILTAAAFRNAVRIALALGLSLNCVRHLIAISIETGLDFDVVGEIERAGDIPQLAQVRPNGPDRIEALEAHGGCRAIMAGLADRLDRGAISVSGLTVAQTLETAPTPDGAVIRPVADPFRTEPGLAVLRGNLAPDGAIVKLSAVPPEVRCFSGPARVFETEAEAIDGLETGEVRPGEVVVLRYSGPMGGPGTVFAASFMAALVGAGLGSRVAVVTDGELSGLNSGITIGQVMPEAAEGGPLAVVRTGDPIEIDLEARTLKLVIPQDELAQRLADLAPYTGGYRRGWLELYRQLVQPMSKGSVLGQRPWPNDTWER